ncbi:MAG: MBL fold metallo-hydrolase [Holosporaceae bacterium]|jgi:phosphoribosyl 1,2-cyclic phosphate phosphodiesterase|nr:MBL fold metallo-hydrolase [Holosporaceae bacterium]
MKVTILGCGSSTGVPALKYGWGSCTKSNEKNIRTRSSIILETEATSLLVDMSPDLRQQLLRYEFCKSIPGTHENPSSGSNQINGEKDPLANSSFRVDGVIFTHAHYDHTSGINELRPIFFESGKNLEIYSNAECIAFIKNMFFYLFEDTHHANSGSASIYKPYISANVIANDFRIGDISGICFEQDHGHSKSMGIRIGNFAYTTDVVAFPEESFGKLYGLDVWVVDCLSPQMHSNHANIDSILRWVEILKPKMTYLTHMSIRMDYDHLLQILPPHIRPAYDQMQFEVNN